MVYSCGMTNDNRIMIRGCVYHQKERHNMVNSPRRSMIQSEKRKSCTGLHRDEKKLRQWPRLIDPLVCGGCQSHPNENNKLN
ncbi:hypothetical protein Hanom_Chr12g01090321 [Helianthus anomalus]